MSATDIPFVGETPQKEKDNDSLDYDDEDRDWDKKDAWQKCIQIMGFRGDDEALNAFENAGTTDIVLFLELHPKDISSLVYRKNERGSGSKLKISTSNMIQKFQSFAKKVVSDSSDGPYNVWKTTTSSNFTTYRFSTTRYEAPST